MLTTPKVIDDLIISYTFQEHYKKNVLTELLKEVPLYEEETAPFGNIKLYWWFLKSDVNNCCYRWCRELYHSKPNTHFTNLHYLYYNQSCIICNTWFNKYTLKKRLEDKESIGEEYDICCCDCGNKYYCGCIGMLEDELEEGIFSCECMNEYFE